jgi:uncharacterized protein (TIGR02246 family)
MSTVTRGSLRLRSSALAAVAFGLGIVVGAGAIPAAHSTQGKSAATSVEARLQRLEDEQEIRDVLYEYGRRLDSGDLEGYAQLFAKDGEWIGGFGSAKGPADILALMQKFIKTKPDPKNVHGFHVFTNPVVHVDGDHATSLCKLIFMGRGPDNRPVPMLGGHYDDTFVREDGHWKFQRRVVMLDIPYQDPRDESTVKGSKPPI